MHLNDGLHDLSDPNLPNVSNPVNAPSCCDPVVQRIRLWQLHTLRQSVCTKKNAKVLDSGQYGLPCPSNNEQGWRCTKPSNPYTLQKLVLSCPISTGTGGGGADTPSVPSPPPDPPVEWPGHFARLRSKRSEIWGSILKRHYRDDGYLTVGKEAGVLQCKGYRWKL